MDGLVAESHCDGFFLFLIHDLHFLQAQTFASSCPLSLGFPLGLGLLSTHSSCVIAGPHWCPHARPPPGAELQFVGGLAGQLGLLAWLSPGVGRWALAVLSGLHQTTGSAPASPAQCVVPTGATPSTQDLSGLLAMLCPQSARSLELGLLSPLTCPLGSQVGRAQRMFMELLLFRFGVLG